MPASDDTPDETRDALDSPTASRRDATRTPSFDPNRTVASTSRPSVDTDTCATGIPGYVVLAELGQGGMGVVYRARQSALNREVALKTILRADATRATLARFWAEAEAMAAVKHPNVVQVFELGEHAGRPFMAMELVPGGSLSDVLDSGSIRARVAAGLLEKIARGVAAAHDLGIVHRDIKPANVLLDGSGEPKVADFGLAKWRSTDLTRTQTLMGTPAYMAPEQAAGRAKFLGPQADVWSLGVVLYECLAGNRPFTGASVQVLLAQIQTTEPQPPRKRVRGLSRDLDTIVMKCLAKEPERRYPTAGELADDLRRFLDGRPIAARPVGRAERLVLWARRKPTAAAAYGLSVLAVALALVVFVVAGLWRAADRARGTAEAATQRADDARGRVENLLGVEKGLRGELQTVNGKLAAANTNLQTALGSEQAAKQQAERANERLARFNYGQTIKAAYQAWRDNKIGEARALLARTRPDLRAWEYDYVHRLCYGDTVTLSHHDLDALGYKSALLTHGSWSPDGSKVVTSDNSFARLWNASTGTLLHEWKLQSLQPSGFAFSPDGSKLFVADKVGTGYLRDATTGRPLAELKGPADVFASAVWFTDGTKVLTFSGRYAADGKSVAVVWNAATGARIAELKGLTKWNTSGAFSPDGSKVLLSSQDSASAWDATTGKQLVEFKGHTAGASSAAWSPDGLRVVTAGFDRTVRTWDATGEPRGVFKGHADSVVSAVFSPDGSKVLSASDDGTARVWDAASGTMLTELRGHAGALVGASFSRDGTLILTASKDGTARVWSAAGGVLLNEMRGHEKELVSASFGPDESKVLTASKDRTARVWDVRRNAAHTALAGQRGPLASAVWSPDGSKLAIGTMQSPVQILDARTEQKLTELAVKGATALRWSPDGSKLFVVSSLEPPTVWDARSGTRLISLASPKYRPGSSGWSSDGSKLLTTALDSNPRLWNARTGTLLLELERPKGERFVPHEATFSPDGTRLLGSPERLSRVWDAATGKQLVEFKGHTMPISVSRFSPDGAKVLTGAKDATARVWDAATGAQLHVLTVPSPGFVTGVLWSANGTKVVTASTDGTARVWDAQTGTLIAELGSYTSEITSVSWLAHESRVLTAGRDNVLRVWDAASGAELLALPSTEHLFGPGLVHVSPDGTRVLVRGATEGSAVIYDARPVNRLFVRYPTAPPPRLAGRVVRQSSAGTEMSMKWPGARCR